MARTLINSQTPVGPYPGSVSAGELALAFTVADTSNNNEFALSGHELLLAWNTDTNPHTITTQVLDVRRPFYAALLTRTGPPPGLPVGATAAGSPAEPTTRSAS